jgi:hypothetical protein
MIKIRRRAGIATERVNPPLGQRQAPSRAHALRERGLQRLEPRPGALTIPVHELSAQADIAGSQPRIHSPGLGQRLATALDWT